MTKYSNATKKQLEVYEGSFSTTMTNYKNAFIQCRQNPQDCDTMQSQLTNAQNILADVKNMVSTVKANVGKNKTDIGKNKMEITDQAQEFQDKLTALNTINDSDNASNTLRKNKKQMMKYEYFTLAYYVLTNILLLYLLHKQYKFSALYFLAVFLVLLIVIFVLAWWGIPYN